jgi:hypothetical protein
MIYIQFFPNLWRTRAYFAHSWLRQCLKQYKNERERVRKLSKLIIWSKHQNVMRIVGLYAQN